MIDACQRLRSHSSKQVAVVLVNRGFTGAHLFGQKGVKTRQWASEGGAAVLAAVAHRVAVIAISR